MKKTSGTPGNNRPAVRNAITPVQLSNRTTGNKGRKSSSASSKSSKRSSASSKKKSAKKNSGGKIAAVIGVVAVAAVIGIVGFQVWNKSKADKKYEVSMADGTIAEMTVDEMKASFTPGVFAEGTYINGVNVAGMSIDSARDAVKAAEPEAPLAVDINLSLDGSVYPVDLSSLPLESNIEDILNQAMNYARPSDDASAEDLVSCYNARQQMKVAPVEYCTAYTINSDGIGSIIHGILDPMASEARDAVITGFSTSSLRFEYTPSAKGYVIDVDKAVDDVKALLDTGVYSGTVAVDAQITEPSFTTEMLDNDFGLMAETHSTTTSNNSRNHNIRITCEKIDGMVLQPGESFSFNDEVGQRTAEAGYEMAGTIVNGQYQDDFGGGICQVSSMIYQSALKSELEIVERHWHSWPSSYVDPGTDATVDWGGTDFVFKNDSGYPIAIHAAYNNDEKVVSVSIYGHKLPDGIHYDFIGQTVSTNPRGTDYVPDPAMPVGTTATENGGHDGVTAVSYLIKYDAAGNEISRDQVATTSYSTVNTTIKVGVLNPDGTLATLDTTTGQVTGAVESVPSDSSDTSDVSASDPSATDPTDTAATSETQPTDTQPSETQPSETQPSETQPSETQPSEPADTTPAPTDPAEGEGQVEAA